MNDTSHVYANVFVKKGECYGRMGSVFKKNDYICANFFTIY